MEIEQQSDERAMVVLFTRIFVVICPDKIPPRDVPPTFKDLFDGVNLTSVLRAMIRSEPKNVSSGMIAQKYGIPLRSVKNVRRELSDTKAGDDGGGS